MSERDRVPIFESKQLSRFLSVSVSPSEKTERRIRALSLLFFACLGSGEPLVVQIRNQGRKERERGRKHYIITFCLISLTLFLPLSPDHLPPRHSHGKKFECFQALGLSVGDVAAVVIKLNDM